MNDFFSFRRMITPVVIQLLDRICELLILAFRVNETLTDIRNALQNAKSAPQTY